MAKKRKHTHKHGRRRMGAVKGGEATKTLLGVAVGALGGRFLAKMLPSTTSPMIVNIGQIGLGAVLAFKSKNPMLKGIGGGLVASGVIAEGVSFNLISGIGEISTSYQKQLADAARVPAVGAARFPSPNVVGAFPDVHVVGGLM